MDKRRWIIFLDFQKMDNLKWIKIWDLWKMDKIQMDKIPTFLSIFWKNKRIKKKPMGGGGQNRNWLSARRVEKNAQYYRRVLKKEKYTRKTFWSKSLKKVKVQKWCQNGSTPLFRNYEQFLVSWNSKIRLTSVNLVYQSKICLKIRALESLNRGFRPTADLGGPYKNESSKMLSKWL